jgi:hypothetical protein
MYKYAYAHDDQTVFYFDELGNKYVARGGGLLLGGLIIQVL